MNGNEDECNFLGFDLSTQQLKAVILNRDLEILCEEVVNFDADFLEFRTNGGVNISKTNPNEITAPTIMWVKAIDLILDKLIVKNVDFSKIRGISGTAQQHGSVYWQNGAGDVLKKLDSSNFLHVELASCFSVPNSPTWMDSTTKLECKLLEEAVGGPQKLSEITGSRAYERFTGPQIARICTHKTEAYRNTERISLVSSFLATIFLGKYAPIDYSDGSGMNLLDMNTKKWHPKLLETCGEKLADKLGEPMPTCEFLGTISNYFVERYGFSEDCKIISFSGDNPSSLIGMQLKNDWLAVSLGTSDTIFSWIKQPKMVLNGHIFINPINHEEYMSMLCFKNGSLTREKIRNKFASGSWEKFNELLESTPRGNFGYLALHFDVEEILPQIGVGEFRFNKDGEKLSKFSSREIEIRAGIEGQFLTRRVFLDQIGYKINENTKILATGGASANEAILQVLSDVFGCPVYKQEIANSALIGAAIQAAIGCGVELEKIELPANLKPRKICEPYANSEATYGPAVQKIQQIIQQIVD